MANKEHIPTDELAELYLIYRDLFVPAFFAQLQKNEHQERLDRLKEMGYVQDNGLVVPTVIWSMLRGEL